VLKDMMTRFELYRPTALDDAFDLIDEYGSGAWLMAGGQDSLDWFKDRAKRPRAVVDLNRIDGLRGIRESGDGI
jgi:xanthine dehydrogenase YagS FAD-binding subunit